MIVLTPFPWFDVDVKAGFPVADFEAGHFVQIKEHEDDEKEKGGHYSHVHRNLVDAAWNSHDYRSQNVVVRKRNVQISRLSVLPLETQIMLILNLFIMINDKILHTADSNYSYLSPVFVMPYWPLSKEKKPINNEFLEVQPEYMNVYWRIDFVLGIKSQAKFTHFSVIEEH